MNPATGTFTSMDTYGGTVFDPTSLHKYLYANANPVSYTDPSGYVSLGEVVVTSTIIGALTGAAFGAGISILRQLILNPKGKIDWKEVGKAALIGFGLGAAFGLVAGFAKFYLLAASILVLGQLIFIGIACYATYIDWENYENGWLLLLDLALVGLSVYGLTKGLKNLENVAKNTKQTSGASKTAKTSTDPSPENNNTAGEVNESGTSGRYSGELQKVAKPDPAADELAIRINGESRVKFSNDPAGREFDAISDEYIAQAKPVLKTIGKSWRNQTKATFEAAVETGRRPYFQFQGEPEAAFLSKIAEYEARYGVKAVIDIEPLNATN